MRMNDVGVIIRVHVTQGACCAGATLDVASASVLTFVFQAPDKTTVSRPGRLTTTGADGLVEYRTAFGDFPAMGPWMGQLYVEMPPGRAFCTSCFSFQVGAALSPPPVTVTTRTQATPVLALV